MKKTFLMLSFFSIVCVALAQSASEVGKIALSVIMPENVDGLDVSQLSKIETKIMRIVSLSGLAASGYNNNFVIYPKFAIYETNVVEGGMQNITVVTCELSLFIKQVDNNVIFSTISKQIKGSGNNKTTAITNAISEVPTNDQQFKTFIEIGKTKIIQYYESKCQDIITKSESLVKMDDYEQAFGLLMTVPEEVSCYNKVQEKSIEAYNSYKEKQCVKLLALAGTEFEKNNINEGIDIIGKIDPSAKCYENAQSLIKKNQEKLCKTYLLKSKTAIASKDFYNASNYLMQINPETSCYTEAQVLIKDIESKITEAEKREWEFKQKQYKNNVELEKQRINAVKDIAVAYYKSKPTTVNYSYIIK